MDNESRTWKAIAYDKAVESLNGAMLGDACGFMMGGLARILVFESNEKADEFGKVFADYLRIKKPNA